MWNVEERFSPKAIESLAALGFKVGSTRGVVRVEKYGCGAEFRKGTDGLYQMTIVPAIMLKGQFTRLWDAGYQKFLITDDGHKIPALASHLQNLRKFNEELRTALGVPTFYNEALGSVSQVSVYDRVKGRKGDTLVVNPGDRRRRLVSYVSFTENPFARGSAGPAPLRTRWTISPNASSNTCLKVTGLRMSSSVRRNSGPTSSSAFAGWFVVNGAKRWPPNAGAGSPQSNLTRPPWD